MATYSVNNGTTKFTLPDEGTIFRVAGDNGDAVYRVVNGQIVTLASSQPVATTDFYGPGGTVIHAGQPLPSGFDTHGAYRAVNPGYSGVLWSNTSGAGLYQQQTGTDFNSLPVFNMADIQTTLQQNGGKLPTGTTSAPPVQTNGLPLTNPNPVNSTTGNFQPTPAPSSAPTSPPPAATSFSGGAVIPTPPPGTPAPKPVSTAPVTPPTAPVAPQNAPTTTPAPTPTPTTSTPPPTPPVTPPSTPPTSTPAPATVSTAPPVTPQTTLTDQQFQNLLNSSTLTADQKAALQSVYNAVGTNDQATADKLIAAMQSSTKFSDPYFKAQINLVTDALSRGLQSKDGDLAFQESQLTATLNKLKADTAATDNYLSLGHSQQLKDLASKLETDLQDTRDNMAATGFTNSTRRSRAEQILNTNNEGLVESSNNSFAFQTGNNARNLDYQTNDMAVQVANLQRLAQAGKLDLTRSAESQVGSKTLASLGYTDLLGGVGGSIPRQQVQDAASFASSFVF